MDTLFSIPHQAGAARPYRGRLAPSPTGHLHLGHARTFWRAQERAQAQANGTVLLRIEDLDFSRCKPEFVDSMLEDLRWFGFHWAEGPDLGGPHQPYVQSERRALYRRRMEQLREDGFLYPCRCSRQDVLRALAAPHQGEEEPLYPGTCRVTAGQEAVAPLSTQTGKISWRFRVPEGETISFVDGGFGLQEFVAGRDFGDFIVWRHDDIPSYQLAVVTDDGAMGITEVVRGADLLLSTARQILLYRALGLVVPAFYHCPLVRDEMGRRLAKRHEALSLRTLRLQGTDPASLRESWPTG